MIPTARILVITGLLAALPFGIGCGNRSGDRLPNVILISIDTLRMDHLGTYGYERAVSPNLDSLAEFSVVFEQAISQAPWTLPSHAALFASLPPSVLDLGDFTEPRSISDRAVLLAEFLKDHGYQNHAITAGGFVGPAYGFPRGFDEYKVGVGMIEDTVAGAIDYLENRDAEQPFFLFLPPYCVHSYDPPRQFRQAWVAGSDSAILRKQKNPSKFMQSWTSREQIAQFTEKDWEYAVNLYDATIAWVDYHLGSLFETLDERGLFTDSIIVLTSDHGEELGERGGSGHGYTLFDENLRVPLFIYHKDLAPRRIDQQVRLIDVAPTIADLLGLEPPVTWEGVSLRKIMDGARPGLVALSEDSHSFAIKSIRTNTHKYILSTRLPHERLFDLRTDPHEKDNIAETDLDTAKKMRKRMRAIIKKNAANQEFRNGEAATLDQAQRNELDELGYVSSSERVSRRQDRNWLEVIEKLDRDAYREFNERKGREDRR